jgi:hypothetical protein
VNPEGDVNINDSLQGLGNYDHLRNTHFYDTLINTYICSSNTLLAMAFVTVLASSSSFQEGFDEEAEEENGVSQGVYRFGNFPFCQNSIDCTNSDCVASSRLAPLIFTAHRIFYYASFLMWQYTDQFSPQVISSLVALQAWSHEQQRRLWIA